MSKKIATQSRNGSDGWIGYVNWSPLASDREKVLAFMGSERYDEGEYLLQLCESGYTTTFSYDEKASCHRISITGKGRHCPNTGYTLSIRASTPGRCLGLAAYYVFVLCESGDWLVDKAQKEIW